MRTGFPTNLLRSTNTCLRVVSSGALVGSIRFAHSLSTLKHLQKLASDILCSLVRFHKKLPLCEFTNTLFPLEAPSKLVLVLLSFLSSVNSIVVFFDPSRYSPHHFAIRLAVTAGPHSVVSLAPHVSEAEESSLLRAGGVGKSHFHQYTCSLEYLQSPPFLSSWITT